MMRRVPRAQSGRPSRPARTGGAAPRRDERLSEPDPPQVRPVGSPEDAVVLTYRVPG